MIIRSISLRGLLLSDRYPRCHVSWHHGLVTRRDRVSWVMTMSRVSRNASPTMPETAERSLMRSFTANNKVLSISETFCHENIRIVTQNFHTEAGIHKTALSCCLFYAGFQLFIIRHKFDWHSKPDQTSTIPLSHHFQELVKVQSHHCNALFMADFVYLPPKSKFYFIIANPLYLLEPDA